MLLTEKIRIKKVNYLNSLTDDELKEFYYIDKNIDIKKDKFKGKTSLENNIKKLRKIIKENIECNGICIRNYINSKNKDIGRLFCNNGVQMLPKVYRNFLMSSCTEIDICNCQPTILLYLCKKYNIKSPNLEKYVRNRDNILQITGLKKIDFIISINSDDKINKHNSFLNDFDEEVKNIQKEIIKIDDFKEFIENCKKEKNIEGSIISLIVQDLECKILLIMYNYFIKNDIEVSVLIFDGLFIEGNYETNYELIHKLQDNINKNYENLNIILKANKVNSIIKMPDNFTQNIIITEEWMDKLHIFGQIGAYNVADVLYYFYSDTYKYVKETNKWFIFINKIWYEKDISFEISLHKEFTQLLLNKINNLEKLLKTNLEQNIDKVKINENITLLKNTCKLIANSNFKNNIIKEARNIFYDETFYQKINKQKMVMPLKNGKIININTLEVRDRVKDDIFSFEADVNYIPNLTQEQKEYANNYFSSLFIKPKQTKYDNETTQCFIDVLKNIISGKVLRYIFFLIGEGKNGKSLLLNILNKIFSNFIDVINKSVVIQKKIDSALNTEIEKLEKCRLAYTSELDSKHKLRKDLIKEITGSDKLNLRTLFKSDVSITPTCTLFVITNEIGHVNLDEATIDRLMFFPFLNKFEVNGNKEKELLDNKDILFSYILQKGNLKDNFESSNGMLIPKVKYIESMCYYGLKIFISDEIEITENKNNIIEKEIFMMKYNEWCEINDYPIDNRSSKALTIALSDYGINKIKSNNIVYFTNIKFNRP